jgi:hypothetical protein
MIKPLVLQICLLCMASPSGNKPPRADQIGGSARVGRERAGSQKVTSSWASMRPDRVAQLAAEGQRAG